MRRILGIGLGLIGAAVLIAAVPAGGEGDDEYLVRAVFDNGSFIVPGEDVRIAGANAGVVESVDVSLPGEVVSRKPGEEMQDGKAIAVLRITDPGFMDFRSDARCILRPQSLIGERYVNCRPTLPRGPDSPQPPPLEQVPEGEPGAGQYLLPVENNGTTVDIDLVQNVMRQPTAERLRLILNELGAGFAARGDEIAEIVRRADPTLRDADRVLAILAAQRRQLADLASNSERILDPLSRERDQVAGFIREAGATAQATAERRADLELALSRFPAFLRELQSTMAKFRGFSDSALPVVTDLGRGAPALTDATSTLGPFADASTRALLSLGEAGEASGPKFAASAPIVRASRDLARAGVSPSADLNRLLRSTRETRGFEKLMDLIYNTGGTANGFDAYGHFMRTSLVATNCVDYSIGWASGCDSRFAGAQGKGPPITDFPLITDDQRPVPEDRAAGSPKREEPADDAIAEILDAVAEPAGSVQASPGPRLRRGAVGDLLEFLVGR